jgi:hypothetical protein
MKKYTKSLLMALLLASAGTIANAADFTSSTNVDISAGSANFGPVAEFSAGNFGKTFSDTYTFSTTGLSDSNANISWSSADDASALVLSHFDLYKVGTVGAIATGSHASGLDLWELATGSLSTGNYYLKVEGTINTSDSISYAGNIAVTAVPEADTYAMLLAGLGLVGVVASRRKAVAA